MENHECGWASNFSGRVTMGDRRSIYPLREAIYTASWNHCHPMSPHCMQDTTKHVAVFGYQWLGNEVKCPKHYDKRLLFLPSMPSMSRPALLIASHALYSRKILINKGLRIPVFENCPNSCHSLGVTIFNRLITKEM